MFRVSRFTLRRAYTLIELIVVIAITGLISGIMLVYGGVGREQINLSLEAVKIAQMISRAKALAVATYTDPSSPCGFGVHFDYSARKYSLRSYRTSPGCESVLGIASSAVLNEFDLGTGLAWQRGGDSIEDVVFIPPDPKVYLFSNGTLLPGGVSGKVYLLTSGGEGARTITVNPAGQVTF
jgi:prepilin-type N-terminal cleavage/methylation domain-containing protein